MSKADELLDSLTESQTETRAIDQADLPHIVVYPNRDVFVPEELKEIAVQHEHNIKTVTFDCPRYWDGHDLTKLTIYINYERSDKEKGRYPVTNVQVDESDENLIHFDWTISGHVTETFGDLTILACAKSVDAEGYEKEHWNSHRYEEMTVAEGLECGDAIAEQYPDEIAVILGRIDELSKHTHTAKDVGAIPEGGDKDAMVDFQRVIAEVLVALNELGIYNSETLHVFLKNVSTDPNTAILQLEGEAEADEPPKEVVVRGVADPINLEDAANLRVVEALEKGILDKLKKYAKTADVYNRDQIDQLLQNLDKYALAANVYDRETIDQKLQNLDKYATTQYVDDTVGAINAILATLSNGGVSGGES